MADSNQNPDKQIGFVLSHEQFSVPELIEFGVAAEHGGFDLISCSDHFQPWQANEGHAGMAWITLAALGQRTGRIRMGTMVTCPTIRYSPAVVAQAFATLGQLYPGRMYLGLGSGEALNEEAATGVWEEWAERSQRLVEATDLIRELWTGHRVEHDGQHYRVHARLYDVPGEPIPIFMAGNGPKALHRCGEHGDGVISDPKTWQQSRSQFEAGAKAAGKDPNRMPVLMENFVVVGDRKMAQAGAQLWRFLPKAWEGYLDIRDPEAIEQRAMAEVPVDQVLEDWVVGTDPEQHVEGLMNLFDMGATTVLVHAAQQDQRAAIAFYAERVLPAVRQRLHTSTAA
ncbi:MAG TPA: TIGR03557 family F420-dependent LLM class oxidoreductase [Burkholderiales bacterium]|nr:TIGR03557 family F420-dependent LLM class oxidoreductase [Burkholderiales bacterium]